MIIWEKWYSIVRKIHSKVLLLAFPMKYRQHRIVFLRPIRSLSPHKYHPVLSSKNSVRH